MMNQKTVDSSPSLYPSPPVENVSSWGFRNGELHRDVSQLLARPAYDLSPGQMTYQLRHLRLRGQITRIPGTQRYEATDSGQRMALFWLGCMSKTIRPLAIGLRRHSGFGDKRLEYY